MGGFNFNPILSEIQSHMAAMSPAAQAAVKMANPTLPSPENTAAISAPSVLPAGRLLPQNPGPEPASISMPSNSAPITMPSATPSLVTGPRRGQEMMSDGSPTPIGSVMGDTAERERLLTEQPAVDNIYHDVTNSRLGQAHPFLGKLLGGIGQVGGKIGDTLTTAFPGIGREIPGTTVNHNMLLGETNRNLTQDIGNAQKEAQTASENATAGKTNAEIPEVQAQTSEINQRASANEPIEITPEQAQSLGMPELAGEKVSAPVLAGLSRTAQTNTTKAKTTGEEVSGRQSVADTNAKARETVAQTAAESRQSAEDAQDRTREAVARIRATGGTKATANSPTNNSKSRGEMAETMLEQAPGILQEIDKLDAKIGPGAGRWNNFWVKKGGINDPDYAGLDQDLGLYASALAVAHFGARGGGAQFIQSMKKDFSQAQSPEDLKARILHADKWLEGYEQEGKGNSSTEPPANNAPPAGATVLKWEDVK